MFPFFMPIAVGTISYLCHLFVPQNWLASAFTILIVADMCIFGIVDYKKGAEESFNEAVESIEDSATGVEESSNKMAEMVERFRISVDLDKDLKRKAGDIASIAETVLSITEQTNLLALNAAIEAARSGEAGRGSAVVADEIRKLAEENRRSADKIARFLKSVSEGITDLMDNLGKGFEKMKALADHLKEKFEQVQGSEWDDIIDSPQNERIDEQPDEGVGETGRYHNQHSEPSCHIRRRSSYH